MAEDRPLVEQLLDLALYAPIGAALTAADHVPALVAKGRSLLEGRVTVARMVGRMAVGTARRRLETVLSAEAPAPAPRGTPARGAGSAAETIRTRAGPGAEQQDVRLTDRGERVDATGQEPSPPPVDALAIPGYDSLAASQVVQRLGALRAEELETLRRYEVASRKRRTILGRIAQLQGAADDPR